MMQRIPLKPRVQQRSLAGRKQKSEGLPPTSPIAHHQISVDTQEKVNIGALLADNKDLALKVGYQNVL